MMIKNILIIRFRRVGDSVLSMALCHSLKLSFPQAQIHFIINKNIASLYRNHPDVDRVITFDDEQNEGMAYVRRVHNIMAATHYDAIIDMRSTPKTLLFSLCSLSTPYRIGRYKSYNIGVHNYRIPTPAGIDRVTSNLRLMNPLAREGKLIKDRHFPLYISDEERGSFRDMMKQKGIDFSRPVITIAVTTRILGKAWDKLRMAEILRRMMKQYDAQLVANYAGPLEKAVAKDFKTILENNPDFHIDIEAKNLRELCALCANSHFFFGNEGGPRHIAQSFHIPAFAIYPPGIDKTMWLPSTSPRYQGISSDEYIIPQKQAVLTYRQRFDVITTERVWKRMKPMLDEYLPHKEDAPATPAESAKENEEQPEK